MAKKTAADQAGYVQGIRFAGHVTGLVKTLRGFTKGRHSVPDAVNATTLAFLARLSSEELAEESEALFQKARASFGYKRKDLSLDLSPPTALLTARDFSLEIAYAFDGDDPSGYRRTWSLDGFTDLAFLRSPACAELFAGCFQELVFHLTKGASVESVIDAVESLDDNALTVDYPSDCAHCLLTVPGVDANVRFDGAELAMVFAAAGAPADLLDGFLLVRKAFSLAKTGPLSGLLG
jgi:hypothetical protein